jgi:hypothetical protein
MAISVAAATTDLVTEPYWVTVLAYICETLPLTWATPSVTEASILYTGVVGPDKATRLEKISGVSIPGFPEYIGLAKI